jgi:hypothetical protein
MNGPNQHNHADKSAQLIRSSRHNSTGQIGTIVHLGTAATAGGGGGGGGKLIYIPT